MVEGGIRKFHQEVVLLEQAFVMDGKTKVSKVVDDAAKQVGGPVRIAGYLRFDLGEGIEKKSEDFAAEVAAQLKKEYERASARARIARANQKTLYRGRLLCRRLHAIAASC